MVCLLNSLSSLFYTKSMNMSDIELEITVSISLLPLSPLSPIRSVSYFRVTESSYGKLIDYLDSGIVFKVREITVYKLL